MKVSVLIAAQRSSPASLSEALASVAAQTHGDWELIIVEPGSTPETQAALRGFCTGPVMYERIEESSTSAAIRNRLLDLATGDLIAFLDPQDVWLPRHLTNAVQLLGTGTDVAVANARIHDFKSDRIVNEVAMPTQLASAAVRSLFTRDVIPTLSCVVSRRATAITTGLFDPRLRSTEARDFWLRCALNGAGFALTQRATCRCGRVWMPAAERALLVAEQTVAFYEKHRDLSAVPAALRRRLLAGALVAHGRLLRPLDPSRAARCFMRAWSLQPVHVQTLGQFALTEWRVAAPGEPHDVK